MEKIEIRDLRQKEQFILDDAFLNGYARLVGIYAVGVYCSFCRHANKEQTSWPAIETIAEELAISRDSVIRAIKKLEEFGVVVKIRVGKMANNRYVLTNKKTWKLKSEVADSDISSSPQQLHESLTATSNSKEEASKDTQVRTSVAGATRDDEIRSPEDDGRIYKNRASLIDSSLDMWKHINPTWHNWYKDNKTERVAIDRLLTEEGYGWLTQVVPALEKTNAMPYFPSITKPSQLYSKRAELKNAYLRKQAELTAPKTRGRGIAI